MKDSSNDREKWSSIGGFLFNLVKSTHTHIHTTSRTRVTRASSRFKGIAVKVAWWPISKKKKKKSRWWLISSPLSNRVYTIYDVSWNGGLSMGRYSKRMKLILLKFIEIKYFFFFLYRITSNLQYFIWNMKLQKFCCEEEEKGKKREIHVFYTLFH